MCVAVGSKQRAYSGCKKSDRSSQTFITNSICLTGVIDANENRAMSTIDVRNAFLQADNDKRVLMLLCGKVAELMVQVNPNHLHKGRSSYIMCVYVLKALCGILREALLFYKRLRKDLENMGFIIGPYDS